MKLGLGPRLFLAVWLAFVAMAAVELAVVRWQLFGNAPASTRDAELARLLEFADAVALRYREHEDWSFLPLEVSGRKAWARNALARSALPVFGLRVGLLDKKKGYLAGVIANRLLITFASIDQIERPVLLDGVAVGYVVVARSQNPDEALAIAFLLDQQANLLLIACSSVLLGALTAFLLAGHFRRPIRQLLAGARRLEDARFDTRIALVRSDELGELAAAFNHLATRLADTERSRQQWVADTSHELRTPLTVLRAQMEALQDGIRPATPDAIALMLRHVQSLAQLVDDLTQLARADVGERQYRMASCDAWALVGQVLSSFDERFALARLTVTVGAPPARTRVHGDAERLSQMLTNLFENCARYTDAGGRVEVTGRVVHDELEIVIEDSAPGVPEPLLPRLGERFFRVEASRNRALGGAGLGLSLSRQIALKHGGRLEFGPSALGGLRATLMLPLET